ncbi:MAG: hypothetical protein U0841_27225 [Chloroflexia bacterium]
MISAPIAGEDQQESAQPAAREARGVTLAAAFNWSLATLLIALIVVTCFRVGLTSQYTAAAALLAVVGVPRSSCSSRACAGRARSRACSR